MLWLTFVCDVCLFVCLFVPFSDAIAFEFQYMLAPGNFSFSLLDKSSYEFKTRSFEFCKDVSSGMPFGVDGWLVGGWLAGWML